MPAFTCHTFEKVKEFEGKNGTLIVWKLGLEDDKGNKFWAEQLKKPGNEPTKGQVNGTVEDTDYGKKFKADKPAGFGGGGGGGARGHSPEDRSSIESQTAAKVAGEIVCALIAKAGITTVDAAQYALKDLADTARKAIQS